MNFCGPAAVVQRPVLNFCSQKPLVFSGAESARLAASLERGNFNEQEQSGILAQIVLNLRKSSAKIFVNFTIQNAKEKLCQVPSL